MLAIAIFSAQSVAKIDVKLMIAGLKI